MFIFPGVGPTDESVVHFMILLMDLDRKLTERNMNVDDEFMCASQQHLGP